MERKDATIRWTGPVMIGPTYLEDLHAHAETRWMTIVTDWLQRHGEAQTGPRRQLVALPILRGVRGLTPDGEPHRLRTLTRWIHRAW